MPGVAIKDRTRAAIQFLSTTDVAKRSVYTHTGWRKIGDEWVYLDSGGAIGTFGTVPGAETSLSGGLRAFEIPSPLEGPSPGTTECPRSSRGATSEGDQLQSTPCVSRPSPAPNPSKS